jgi:teichuronic acid biosynthesis glycosyltransferase TuaG
MPNYNYGRYISGAIESVLNQTFEDFELIIFDDCSTDSSRKIIESYQGKDKRIKSFFHEKNMGIALTTNDLQSKASGKYIAHLDSDDLWEPSKLSRQLAILQKNDSMVVWSEGRVIDENGVPTGKTFTQMNLATKKKKSGIIFEELLFGNFIFRSSLIYKRDLAKDIRYDAALKFLNDYEFVVNLAKNQPFYFIKEPLAKYRLHGKNIILSTDRIRNLDNLTINKYFLRQYGLEISERARANLLFKTARNYHFLNQKDLSKLFLIRALKNNFVLYQLKYGLFSPRKSFIVSRDFLELLL